MHTNNLLFFFMLGSIQLFGSGNPNQLDRPEGFWHEVGKYFTEKAPILKPLFQPTHPESQRASWNTGYIAELIPTGTNIGFLMTAYSHKNTAPIASMTLAFAGIVSALSHAIPYQILNTADKIAAVASVFGVMYDTQLYKLEVLKQTLSNPLAAGLLAVTGIAYIADISIPRSNMQRKDEYKYLHGLWHILAALLAHTTLHLNQK